MALNTQTTLDGENGARTNSTLSTQIIIKVGNNPVGALQELRVAQTRDLQRIEEVGTDGVIEIVPRSATQFVLNVNRVVFDLLRLPEAFSRGFRFISAQRVPFDVEVMDISNVDPSGGDVAGSSDVVSMTYKNCWFNTYETPYTAGDYVITESATIWAETAFVSGGLGNADLPENLRGLEAQTDDANIERAVNQGDNLGSLSASGLVNAFLED